MNNELRIIFDVEIISLVTSKKKFSEKFKQIYIPNDKLTLIHHKENNLIMDAVDENYGLYNQVDVKIYSNAIFSYMDSHEGYDKSFELNNITLYGN